MNVPTELIWTATKESTLRGLKETPLRALQMSGMKISGIYAMLDCVSNISYEPAFGANYAYYEATGVTVPWVKTRIVANVPSDSPFDVSVNAGLTQFDSSGSNWVNAGAVDYAYDFVDFQPHKYPKTWTLASNTSPSNSSIISGFALYPMPTKGYLHNVSPNPVPPYSGAARKLGAVLTLLKVGTRGIVTLHDIITPPTPPVYSPVYTPPNGGLLSARDPANTFIVNVTAASGPQTFLCPSNKALCFWIGKIAADLPNSGPPDYTPVQFNPFQQGFLTTYSPLQNW